MTPIFERFMALGVAFFLCKTLHLCNSSKLNIWQILMKLGTNKDHNM
jgi:hypothetical protein